MGTSALASMALKVVALALGGLVVILANVGNVATKVNLSLLGLGLFALGLAALLKS